MDLSLGLPPTNLINQIIHHLLPPNSLLEFSKYVYLEKGITESRRTFHVRQDKLSINWVNDQIKCLGIKEELAFHSKVIVNRNVFHIPLIDFFLSNKEQSIEIIQHCFTINGFLGNTLYLFDSGNSYHGYIDKLLTRREWIIFLGDLLLCNNSLKYLGNLTDSRWIGHSLINKFSSLRISNNTEKYNSTPRLVGILDL